MYYYPTINKSWFDMIWYPQCKTYIMKNMFPINLQSVHIVEQDNINTINNALAAMLNDHNVMYGLLYVSDVLALKAWLVDCRMLQTFINTAKTTWGSLSTLQIGYRQMEQHQKVLLYVISGKFGEMALFELITDVPNRQGLLFKIYFYKW